MNRIQLRAPESEAPSTRSPDLDFGVLTTSEKCRSPHSLFAPMHYERNYAYPLLVWLHGHGGDERQLQRIMPLISMRNYVAVSPRGTRAMADGASGYEWDDSEGSIATATQHVFECIDAASERFHIAPHRVFLAGFECGGSMAFRIGMQYPERFAGLLSVGGPFPNDGTPLSHVRQSRELPLFIALGRDSERYPIDQTCRELRLFHVAGLSVTLRQYPCGDELNTQMLHDIDAWTMEQVTGIPSTSDDEPPVAFGDN